MRIKVRKKVKGKKKKKEKDNKNKQHACCIPIIIWTLFRSRRIAFLFASRSNKRFPTNRLDDSEAFVPYGSALTY